LNHGLPGIDGKKPILGGEPINRGASTQGSVAQSQAGVKGLSVLQSRVLQLITNTNDEVGIDIGEIHRALKGSASDNQVNAAVDFLSNEGHVYTTTDDRHFKATDA